MSDKLREALEACRAALETISNVYGLEGTVALSALNKADAALAQPQNDAEVRLRELGTENAKLKAQLIAKGQQSSDGWD